jgi:hypothetical protein
MRRLVLSRFFVAGVGNATMVPERLKDIKEVSRWYGTLGMWMAGVIIPWIMIAWGAGFASPHYTSPQKFMTFDFFLDTLLSLRFLSSCSHGESTSYVIVCVDLLC